MTKTSKSQLEAIKRYNTGSKYIQLKFTPNQIAEYNRIALYCGENDLSLQGYIKSLIKADLDGKGISYPIDINTSDMDKWLIVKSGRCTFNRI